MISKKAVAKYLNRQLDTYDFLKKEPTRNLDAFIAELDPVPDFGHVKLKKHQKACFILLQEYTRFLPFLDMGLGKTLLTLITISYRKQCGEKPRAIVFVPSIAAVDTWIEECEKHTPHLKLVPLTGTTKQNRHALMEYEGDIFVMAYASAVAMLSVKVKKGKKFKWTFTPDMTRETFAGFDTLVMDEIQRAKNHESLTFRMLRAITKMVDFAYGLTGTPFGKDLMVLWAEMFLVDLGDTLGTTLGMYREVFFEDTPGYFGGVKYRFKKEREPDLQRLIKNVSIRYEIDECEDMPPKIYVKKVLQPTKGMAAYYNQAVDRLNAKVARVGRDYKQLESEYMILRQLASGYLTVKEEFDDGRKPVKTYIDMDYNPKLDTLLDLIDAMPAGKKMIVFHFFTHTSEIIGQALTKEKIGHARVWGGQKDTINEIRKFKKKKDCRVLVINDTMGSESLNLQMANYVVFFEQPLGSIKRKQAEYRAWRTGQEWKVFIIDLLMKGTVDAGIHADNITGKNTMQRILSGRGVQKIVGVDRLKEAA